MKDLHTSNGLHARVTVLVKVIHAEENTDLLHNRPQLVLDESLNRRQSFDSMRKAFAVVDASKIRCQPMSITTHKTFSVGDSPGPGLVGAMIGLKQRSIALSGERTT